MKQRLAINFLQNNLIREKSLIYENDRVINEKESSRFSTGVFLFTDEIGQREFSKARYIIRSP